MKKRYISLAFLVLFFSLSAQTQDRKANTDTVTHTMKAEVKVRTIRYKEGFFTSFDQMLPGLMPVVQAMSNGGSPFSGSTILIRKGTSFSDGNEPLIILDGVPLEKGVNYSSISAQLNWNDIESVSLVKDGFSNAFYGGNQGSNGIIYINTKKNTSEKFRIELSSVTALQTPTHLPDVMSADEFRNVINTTGSAEAKNLLTPYSTNWFSEIFRPAIATNHTLSTSGKAWKWLPIRASVSFIDQDGILLKDNAQKLSGSLMLSPSFFKNYLKIRLNIAGNTNKNTIGNQNAIIAALWMDPTKPVSSNDDVYQRQFGGYWQWTSYNSINKTYSLNNFAPHNPLSLLNFSNITSNQHNYFINFNADYKLHFLPDLSVNFMFARNATYRYPKSLYSNLERIYVERSNVSDEKYFHSFNTLRFGLDYQKELGKEHKLGISAAYLGQKHSQHYEYYVKHPDGISTSYGFVDLTLNNMSFIGKLDYTYQNAYTFRAGIRRDGNSSFSSESKWFNSLFSNITYNLTNGILKNSATFNDLRVQLNYGKSGNIYSGALKPETTHSYDIIIDYGMFGNRLWGTVDVYARKSTDIIAMLPFPLSSGGGFGYVPKNTGEMIGKGIEIALNTRLVSSRDMDWTCGLNASYQTNKITSLGNELSFYTSSPKSINLISTINKTGNTPNMFYVLQQIYGSTGKPIEGIYADKDADTKLSNGDKYAYHSAFPDWLVGFYTQINYKKWDAGLVLRANVGNYVYNLTNAFAGNYRQGEMSGFLRNIGRDYYRSGFNDPQYQSDYYVENASFLKMDNIFVGYDFGKIIKNMRLKVTGAVQNVFTLTKYSGVDPEIPNGIDWGFYPRPRVFSIKVDVSL